MLVLSRKQGEKIYIGHDIEITVSEISGNSVKLSIKAPEDVPIAREEIYQEIVKENIEASAPDLDKGEIELDSKRTGEEK